MINHPLDHDCVYVLNDWELPTMVQKGETVELVCNYQLEGKAELYSLKWYRDNVEFYRYIPSEEPRTTVFLIAGMEILETSTPTHIILSSVTSETGGTFKCEVSEGPPRYVY